MKKTEKRRLIISESIKYSVDVLNILIENARKEGLSVDINTNSMVQGNEGVSITVYRNIRY